MRISLTVSTATGRRRVEAIVSALSDLTPILRRFAAYLRARAKARFEAEGPGWQPLAQSTAHRLIHTFTGPLTRSGAVRETAAHRRLRAQLRRDVRADRLDARVLTAFERATRSTGGGAFGAAVRAHVLGRGLAYEKRLVALARTLDRKSPSRGKRAITRHHRLLGRLASTLRAEVKRTSLAVGSIVEWAGAHNAGATVAHGAHLPARTFIELEDVDVDVLSELISEHGSKAAEEA
jgi:phage gpG-like protein